MKNAQLRSEEPGIATKGVYDSAQYKSGGCRLFIMRKIGQGIVWPRPCYFSPFCNLPKQFFISCLLLSFLLLFRPPFPPQPAQLLHVLLPHV
jgi:hypothetical protein